MKQPVATANPFSAYVGRRVLLHQTPLEIVRYEVRCRRVCFIGKDTSGREVLVPLQLLLDLPTTS